MRQKTFSDSSPKIMVNPFGTAVPFWGQITQKILTGLSPKRDCSPKRVKSHPKADFEMKSRLDPTNNPPPWSAVSADVIVIVIVVLYEGP